MGINVIALTWKGVFQRKVRRQTIVGHSRGGSDRRYSIWHCCNPMDRDRIFLKESRNRTRLEKSGMHKYCRGASHFSAQHLKERCQYACHSVDWEHPDGSFP